MVALDMRKKLEVQKKSETLGLVMQKRGLLTAPTMRVGIDIDISGSMDDEINDGSVQKVLNQCLGVGFKFDDNQSIDVWTFNTGSKYIGTCGINDYDDYVRAKGIRATGGTSYGPVLQDNVDFFFGAQKKGGFLGFGSKEVVDNTPALVLFITDGDNGDGYNGPARVVQAAADKPIYFMMVGINNQGVQFHTLKQLADDMPNVGFVKMNGFNLSDEQLYEAIINQELVDWVKKFTPATV